MPHEVYGLCLTGESSGGLGFWNAVLCVCGHAEKEVGVRAFLEESFPKLRAWHDYLHRAVDRKLWDGERATYLSFDLVEERLPELDVDTYFELPGC